ncbi:AI-2E family transporter [Tsukamurella pseudospumae]|uniref:AI-2E family transporter n=1 Tax=Tsukamurella pseudospumae TaxID=239498 RepID=A0A137ZR57_9ACTN|nr:AI-2E family transporter [Tsukamurella pseudospumae]KXP00656.1 hypothetical protein AXK61_14610 [Tsukamurella pseudospumae]
MTAKSPATDQSRPGTGSDTVPPSVRAAASWSWRLVVIGFALYALLMVAERLQSVVIPCALALLGAALLRPLVDKLEGLGVPRSLAVALSLILAIGMVAGILTFVIDRVVQGVPLLTDQVAASIKQIQGWITDGPLHLRQNQIDSISNSLVEAVHKNQSALTSGALTTATTAGEIVTGGLLMLFTLIFFLYDGTGIWRFVTRVIPRGSREKVREAGRLGFASLVGYVRATVAVAAVDGLCIGIGLAIMGVPLALPLGSLVFVGAFVPIIGAFATGTIAVLVALVAKGPVYALIALGIIVAVMQLEGHVLQPLLLGRAVRLHPLAVVLAIAAGLVLGGIIGALLAVPLVAVLNTAIRALTGDSHEIEEELEEEGVLDPDE